MIEMRYQEISSSTRNAPEESCNISWEAYIDIDVEVVVGTTRTG
jgi:hypothetical protein